MNMFEQMPFQFNQLLKSCDISEAQDFMNSRVDNRKIERLSTLQQSHNCITMQPLGQTLLFGSHWGDDVHIRSDILTTPHVVLPIRGSVKLCRPDCDIGPHDMLLLMPGTRADLLWEAGCTAFVISLDSHALLSELALRRASLQRGSVHAWPAGDRFVRSILNLLYCVSSQHELYEGRVREACQRYWEALLIEAFVTQFCDGPPLVNAVVPSYVRRAAKWVADNIDQPIVVADMMCASQCSRRSLENGFQRFIGCSPARYIRQKKMELAHQRLTGSNDSVGDVAHGCGFNSLSHFTRVYKQHFGETPSQTLKKNICLAQS